MLLATVSATATQHNKDKADKVSNVAMAPGASTVWAMLAWYLHKYHLEWVIRGKDMLKYIVDVMETPEKELKAGDLDRMGKFLVELAEQPALAAADISRVAADCSIMAGFALDEGIKMSKCLDKVFAARRRRCAFRDPLHAELVAHNVLNTVCRIEDLDKIMEARALERIKKPKDANGGGGRGRKRRCRFPDDCWQLKKDGKCDRRHTAAEIAAQAPKDGTGTKDKVKEFIKEE